MVLVHQASVHVRTKPPPPPPPELVVHVMDNVDIVVCTQPGMILIKVVSLSVIDHITDISMVY